MKNQILKKQRKLVNFSEFHQTLSENGQMMGLFSSSEQKPLIVQDMDIGDTISIPIKKKRKGKIIIRKTTKKPRKMKKKLESVTVESVVHTKKTILKDKSHSCKNNIQRIQSYLISEAELTSSVPDYSSLSREFLMEVSQQLWLPIKIDSPDLDSNYLNGYSENIMSNSWFSIKKISKLPNKNSQTTSCLSFMYSPVERMEDVSIKQRKIKKIKKKKLKRNPNNVKYDPNKIPCNFILTTKFNNIIYGRKCYNLSIGKTNLCKKHKNMKNISKKIKYIVPDNLCKHLITQKSRDLDRKGMICNNFVFGSTNDKYCKAHVKRHPNTDNTIVRTYKVRFYPNRTQKIKLQQYFGCVRKTYNECVKDKFTGSFEFGRDKYVSYKPTKQQNSTGFVEKNQFLKQCPKEIRSFSVKEYITNKENSEKAYLDKLRYNEWKLKQNKLLGREKFKIKKIKQPVMDYKMRKQQQSMTINKDSIKIRNNRIVIYPRSFDENPITINKRAMKKDKKLRKTLNSNIFHDMKIIKTTTEKYYFCISTDEKIKNHKIDANNTASCDPGQKTFQTVYNPSEVHEIGKNIDVEVGKIHDRLLNLRKKLRELIKNKKEYRTTWVCNMEYKKLHEKLRNKIIDMHNKAITKLLEYDIIYLPRLNTKKIVEQKTYVKKSKKILNSLAHGAFIRRIINKAKLKGKKVIICSEHLTTQICSICFERNKIGYSRIYNCSRCGYKTERDIQSSKLILMKQIINITKDKIKKKLYATLS